MIAILRKVATRLLSLPAAMAVLSAAPLVGSAEVDDAERYSVREELDNIFEAQLPDGAIAVSGPKNSSWSEGDSVRVVPYFACYTVMGLVRAYEITGDSKILQRARKYLLWHAKHLEDDGTITDYRGAYPDYFSTGDFDSTDSYAALFITAHWYFYQASGDAEFLGEQFPKIQAAVSAMELTLQEDELTWAKPSWHIKYTMDNVEVYQGFFHAAQLARLMGREQLYDEWLNQARATKEAVVTDLFTKTPSPHYAVGKDNGGNRFGSWKKYYPDGMANDFALLHLHAPGEPRFQAAWASQKEAFLKDLTPAEDVEIYMAVTALRASDEVAFDKCFSNAMEIHRRNNWSFYSGHLLRLAYRQHSHLAHIPLIKNGNFKIDGNLDEMAWNRAGRIYFHPLGDTVGFNNPATENSISSDTDSLYEVFMAIADQSLFLAVRAFDETPSGDGTMNRSDGISVTLQSKKDSRKITALLETGRETRAAVNGGPQIGANLLKGFPKGYIFEMSIPLQEVLDLSPPGDEVTGITVTMHFQDHSGDGKLTKFGTEPFRVSVKDHLSSTQTD